MRKQSLTDCSIQCAFDLAANNLALEIKNSVRFHWRQLNPGSSTPEPEFINQFYKEVINRLKTKI